MIALQIRFQEPDGVDERTVTCGHCEIDWIEVCLAMKATRQVRAWIDGRLAFIAAGTDERQLAVSRLVRPIQENEKMCEVDVVPQLSQQRVGKESWHRENLLSKLEFASRVLKDVVVNASQLFSPSVNQTGRRQTVDRTWNAAGEIVD